MGASMVENIMYVLKIFCFVIGVWQLYNQRFSGLIIAALPFFMTGVELITYNDTPWEFLLSGEANRADYEKALFGGMLFLALPVLIAAVCGKDISDLVDNANCNDSETGYRNMLSVTKEVLLKAKSKLEAAEAIEAQAARVVELDYSSGGEDIIELGRLGRKFYVGVVFRAQEYVNAKSLDALFAGLGEKKNTFRQRFIGCSFAIEANDLKKAQAVASQYGDVVLPPEVAELVVDKQTSWE